MTSVEVMEEFVANVRRASKETQRRPLISISVNPGYGGRSEGVVEAAKIECFLPVNKPDFLDIMSEPFSTSSSHTFHIWLVPFLQHA